MDHVTHPVADLQRAETTTQNRILMQVDLLVVVRGKKAVVGKQTDDAANRRSSMLLYVATHLPRMILKLPASSIKRITDSDMQVFMRMMFGRITLNHDLPLGHKDLDPNVIKTPLAVMPVTCLNDDTARDDAIEELLQTRHSLTNVVITANRRFHVAKSDTNWLLHFPFPFR